MSAERAVEIERMRRAAEEFAALHETVARICRSLPNGVSLRSLSVMAEAKQKIEKQP